MDKEDCKKDTLSSLCVVMGDGDWIESKDQSKSGIRLIQTGNIGAGEYLDKPNHAKYISEETFAKLKCTEVLPNDILISRLPSPVGRCCIVPNNLGKSITAVDCTIIRTNPEKCYLRYLYYFLQSNLYFNQIETTGTTRDRVTRKKLEKIMVPLYPLSEQKQIVSILDKVFTKLDEVKEILEKQLVNAEELFQSKLSSYNYPTKPLGELVEIKTGKLDANAAVEDGQYPFFTCSREIFRIDNYAYDCEAILLAGNNASADFNVKHYNGKFNAYQRTYILTVKEGVILDYRYLYYQLLNSLKELKKEAVGAGTKFLRMPMIKSFEIPCPENIDDQQKIVVELDMMNESVNLMKEAYQHKLSCVEELRKSILDKAFHGELLK